MYRALEFVLKETELRQNLVGPGFNPPLPKKDNTIERINIIGEIQAASGFQSEFAYIHYHVFLPKDVEFEDEEDIDALDEDDIRDYGERECNRRVSYTHIARGKVQLKESKYERVFRFCFPIDLQILQPVKDVQHIFMEEGDNEDEGQFSQEQIEAYRKTRSQLNCAYILMQVNSVDGWKRHRIEGYGFCQIPSKPGSFKINVQTWRPVGTLYEKVYSYFLGGGVRIQELDSILKSSTLDELGRHDLLNRFGLQTENSGFIELRLNVVLQNKQGGKLTQDYWREFRKKSSDGLIKFSPGSGRSKSRRIRMQRLKNNKFRSAYRVGWGLEVRQQGRLGSQ